MGYQNVGTPRFYINVIEWLASIGSFGMADAFRTLPVSQSKSAISSSFAVGNTMTGNVFLAILGHLGASEGIPFRMYHGIVDNVNVILASEIDIIVNASLSGDSILPDYDGFSIATYGGETSAIDDIVGINYHGWEGTTGSLVIGTYYQMPHSPDLNLTMTREYGGVKTMETKGGASLSNSFYTKPPAWGNLGAWELASSAPAGTGSPNTKLSSSGRRIWDLSFSYLQDSDMFPLISGLNPYWVAGYNPAIESGDTLLESNNFFSQVIHKTNGGQLPFIFQPDSSNINPDQWAICKLDMNSFEFEQVAKNIYNIKMKIREVW